MSISPHKTRGAPRAPASFTSDRSSPKGLVEQVYAELEERIVSLRLAPGEMLSELQLGKQLGVSRTPVGEALQRLAREGLVTVLPRRGIVVTEINVADQLRLLEFRREVSRFAARNAALRATTEQRESMHAIARAFVDAAERRDEHGMLEADKAFHDLFAICAHNRYASLALDSLDALSRRFWFAHRRAGDDGLVSAQLHAAVADAISEGDPQAAQHRSDALSDYLEAFARATLDRPF